jgi:hypothetical protein
MNINNPAGFILELMKQPVWVIAWVSGLMVINLVSLVYWEHLLSKVILVIFMVQVVAMMGLYAVYGFSKILGGAHIAWVPLLFYILFTLTQYTGGFYNYLIVLSCFIGISLLFDGYDIHQYFKTKSNNKSKS